MADKKTQSDIDVRAQIDALTLELEQHNYQYYVLDRPTISDQAFDMLLKRLEKLESEYPQFRHPDSPTQRVGGAPIKKFTSVRHKYPMLSLGNTYSEADLTEFDQRIQKTLEQPYSYVGELKFDGVAISLTYEKGKLIQAVTRGDGQTGDIVTDNIRTIRSIPLRLQGSGYPDLFEIRGEVFIHRKDFEALNEQRLEAGEEPYANPRNFASGTLKLLNSKEVSKRKLDCFLYYMNMDEVLFATHSESLAAAKSWGFKICEHSTAPTNLTGILNFIHHWENARDQLSFDIDGIVLKIDNYKQRDELGFTAKNPRWAISYKYKPKSASTLLETIGYQVGRTGAVTPVAHLRPVLLAGTVVKRASLYNADEIERLDLHEGDTVFVEKGGEIIPKVTAVDLTKRLPGSRSYSYIPVCPDCGTALVRREGEAIHYCPNESGCPPQQLGKLEHFVARKAMDIQAIGKETLQQFVQAGLIRNYADLYLLKADQLAGLERMGEKTIQNILQGIEASKKIPYERVLFALGIRLVGETVAKTLAREFNSTDALAAATFEELTAIHEIGDRIAQNVVAWFQEDANKTSLAILQEAGVQLSGSYEKTANISEALSGKNFVVSGVFERYERDALKKLIESHGGKVQSGVNAKTDFVVAGANMGPSKLAKAEALKITILDEPAFEALLP